LHMEAVERRPTIKIVINLKDDFNMMVVILVK